MAAAAAEPSAEEEAAGHFVQPVYELLARLGLDPHGVVAGHETEDGGGRLAIAWPDTRVGIAIEGDRPDPFVAEGWYVARLQIAQLTAFAAAFRGLSVLAFEGIRRESQAKQTKTGSKEEERLLAAILAANLPTPDRDFRVYRDDGNELTTPDFVWADLKLAFFMDGLWWHVSLDDRRKLDMIGQAASDDERASLLMNANRSRTERDTNNRSELAMLGWRILTCTDTDLADARGVRKQVERITKTMRMIQEERRALGGAAVTTDDRAAILDLL